MCPKQIFKHSACGTTGLATRTWELWLFTLVCAFLIDLLLQFSLYMPRNRSFKVTGTQTSDYHSIPFELPLTIDLLLHY
jgi:hypothetical protein